MYEFLGFLNIALVATITAPYWLGRLNRYVLKIRHPAFLAFMKFLRKIHKWLACLLLVSIAVHGYLALGKISLNTGSTAGTAFLITAALGFLFYKLKKKGLFKAHKTMALLAVMIAATHILIPKIFHFFI